MSTYREKKLNQSDVRTGIWKFIVSFAVLSAVSFVAVFLFFKSYDIQRRGIQDEVNEYKTLLDRNALLKIQIDSIYQRMSYLDFDKVDNDIFLRNGIMDDIQNARSIMGKDSAKNFKHYAVFLNKMTPMLALKTQVINVSNKRQTAIRNLSECMGKTDKVRSQLRIDPTRKFTGRRR